MRKVVVTGLGVISPIGNNVSEVTDSLKSAKSGISFDQSHKDMGFRSHVSGQIKINLQESIDRKFLRFMGDGASYNYLASTNSATLSTFFKIKGMNYSISSACATSAHCIGHGAELIQMGKQDIVFAGGGEELDWSLSALFDAMTALSSKYNETPENASRAFDESRDGFVIAGGGGVLVLEELEHAKARGAKIYAELVGYGATSDGYDMVQPSGEGAKRCMEMAIKTTNEKVDYINAHGTSTPVGDNAELGAVQEVFGENSPYISSTKSLTGHSLGAAGAQEAIYSLLMMKNNFMCKSAHIENLDESAKNMNILRDIKQGQFNIAMSNSFGFGGTNASLIFKRYN